jgi:hypothetical protein
VGAFGVAARSFREFGAVSATFESKRDTYATGLSFIPRRNHWFFIIGNKNRLDL